jgi:peptide/nickel transport system permease protein
VRALGLLLAGTVVAFALLYATPGGALAPYLDDPHATPLQIAQLHSELGPGRPAYAQYVAWLVRVLRGDLGWSTSNHETVVRAIGEYLPATLELWCFALLAAVLLGILLGVARARAKPPLLSASVTALELLARSLPIFVFGLGLQLLSIFMPLPGGAGQQAFGSGDWLRRLVLPVIVLGVPFGAWSGTVFQHYFRRTNDVPSTFARACLAPFATTVCRIGPALLAATFITEPLFAWPGAGRAFLNAYGQGDFGAVAGFLIAYCAVIVLMQLAADAMLAANRAPQAARIGSQRNSNEWWRSLFSNPLTACGIVLCLALAIAALAAPLLAPLDPNSIDLAHWQGYPLAPGAADHVLGHRRERARLAFPPAVRAANVPRDHDRRSDRGNGDWRDRRARGEAVAVVRW